MRLIHCSGWVFLATIFIDFLRLSSRVPKPEGIVRLESANSYMNESLNNLIKTGEKRWNSISGGWTAWEQLVSWALLATTMLILLIVVVFTVKNSWQLRVVVKGRNIGTAEKGEEDDRTQQQLWDLRSRVVSLKNGF